MRSSPDRIIEWSNIFKSLVTREFSFGSDKHPSRISCSSPTKNSLYKGLRTVQNGKTHLFTHTPYSSKQTNNHLLLTNVSPTSDLSLRSTPTTMKRFLGFCLLITTTLLLTVYGQDCSTDSQCANAPFRYCSSPCSKILGGVEVDEQENKVTQISQQQAERPLQCLYLRQYLIRADCIL